MMKIRLMLLVLSTAFIGCLVSCGPSITTLAELQKYIADPEHRLCAEVDREGVVAKLTWQPGQVLAKKRASLFDGGKFCYFIFSLSKDKQELLRQLNYELYSQMVPVLSFRMREFVSLSADKKDAVEPVDCMFQQTYGMSDANRLLLVFNKSEIQQADQLNIRVKEFGLGLGELSFEIDTDKMGLLEGLDYKTMKL